MSHKREVFKPYQDHQDPTTSAEFEVLASLLEAGHDWSKAAALAKLTPQHLTWLFHHACGCRPPSSFFEALLRNGEIERAVGLVRDASRLLLVGAG